MTGKAKDKHRAGPPFSKGSQAAKKAGSKGGKKSTKKGK
jgi:hypothetical protein